MKISSSDSSTQEYLKNIEKSRKDLISNKEAEIENIKSFYDKRIEDTKKDGEDKFVNAIERNNQVLLDNSINFENRLSNYRDHLNKTQENIQKEEAILKKNHSDQSTLLKKSYEDDIVEKYAEAKENEDSIHQKLQNEVKMIDNKSHFEKNKIENNARRDIAAMAREFNQKDLDAERLFKNNLENDLRTHQEIMRNQKDDFKKMITDSEEKNKRLEKEKLRVQADELKFLDAHQQDLLKQKNTDFKMRYEKLTKEHDEILNNLKNKLESDMKKTISDSAKIKNDYTSKSQDNFYSMELLNPKMLETEKAYIVSIQVPEYEKENLHLQAQGRNVKITLSRKFASESTGMDDSVNHTAKTQLYSKQFKTSDIMNPKSISQKYENGILSFKIAKL